MGTYRELDLGDWTPLDAAIPEIATVSAEDEKAKRAAAAATKAAAEAAARSARIPISSVGASGFEPPTLRPPV